MPITIDQIDAKVEPASAPAAQPAPQGNANREPEAELHRECALLTRIARRAARLHAD